MAIIKTFKYPVNFVSMFEDPIPGSNFIYFQADAYDKNTLNGVFDYGLIFSATGQLATGNTYGYSKPDIFPGQGLGGILILNGECTHVRHRIFNSNNDYRNNLDFAPFASMEPGRPAVSSAYYTDGNSNSEGRNNDNDNNDTKFLRMNKFTLSSHICDHFCDPFS
jgi:hypothetical protein